jgi:hypothetical protein
VPQPPDDPDTARQRRQAEYDNAELCLSDLRGFMRAAESSLYYEAIIPDSQKSQLLEGLTNALPVMGILPPVSSRSLMELLLRLGAPVSQRSERRSGANLPINREEIRYKDLYPLVTGVIDLLNLALKRFHKHHLEVCAAARPVVTLRIAETTDVGEDSRTHQADRRPPRSRSAAPSNGPGEGSSGAVSK